MTKTAVITGAFGNLGAAVARTMKTAGYQVALLDFASTPTAQLAQEFEDSLLLGGVDLTKTDAANAAMSAIAGRFGRLDVLVNVAGGFRWETIETGSLDTWDLMYSMNLRSAVTACKAALPLMRSESGHRIINIGAGAAGKAGLGMGAYAASKAGVARFTEALAEELKDRCITVNAVLPAIIDTPQNRKDMPDADFSRWVSPQAIADTIAFLSSPQASAITGALIPVSNRC